MLVDGSYLNVLRSAGVKVRSRNSQVRAARRAAERAEAKRQRRLDREDAAYALKHGDPLPGAKKPAAKRAAKTVRAVDVERAQYEAWARLAASVPKRKKDAPALLQQSGAGGHRHAQSPDHGSIMGGETKDLK